MKFTKHTPGALVMLLTICSLAGAAKADDDTLSGKPIVSGEVNAGILQKSVDGSTAKFNEYRDVSNGFLLNDFLFKVEGVTTPYFLDVKIKNPQQDNEFYQFNGGIHGKFDVGFTRDYTPHNFGSGKFLLNSVGGGRYEIGDTIQQQLQANEVLRSQRLTNLGVTSTTGGALINPADAQNMAQDAGMNGIVSNLYGSANTVKYGLKREMDSYILNYRITDDAKVWAKVSDEKRKGTRRINQGTYERYNNGITTTTAGVGDRGHLVDYFLVAGIELPETIDYRTTTLNVGTGIYKKNWLADVEYTFTDFNNKNESLIWDNPFRLTSAQATNANDTAGNPFNRGRSALGQISLTPDSQSHDITVSGSAELPLHSRLTGTISYGWITQDQNFDPYTLNGAVIANSVAGTPAAAGLALPQNDLDGEVGTLFQSYQLTSKPADSVAVTAKYRYYHYDNKSDNITFPGYSAFGDSYWRTEKNDVSSGQDALVRNEALSFTRQNAELAVDYRLLKSLTVIAEGFWEGWDREELRIDGTNEVGVGGGFIYKPAKIANLRGNYRYAHRTVDGYENGNTKENPEAVGLVNYDWAERVRNKADLRFQVLPTDAMTVSLSGSYLKDEFGGDNRFGLKNNENATGGLDVTYVVSDNFSFYANYAREHRRGSMKSAAKDDAFNNPATAANETTIGGFNPENYWNSTTTEDVDTIGFGTTIQIIPEKLTLNAGYIYSNSEMDIDTTNPNGAVKLANATAQDWPTIKNKLHEIRADLGYNFTKNLKSGVTYLYEKNDSEDFADTGAYLAGSTYENSTKYLFTGANDSSYEAHVVGAYVKYKF